MIIMREYPIVIFKIQNMPNAITPVMSEVIRSASNPADDSYISIIARVNGFQEEVFSILILIDAVYRDYTRMHIEFPMAYSKL